jgi:hypothetical protein
MLIMAYNVFKTVAAGKAYDAPIPEGYAPGSIPMRPAVGPMVTPAAQGD